jgi:hypothetical protein
MIQTQKQEHTMSKLRAIAPKNAQPKKPKMLIYGKAGVGKTWTSLDFPSVYFIDTEGGANGDHYTDKLKNSGGVYMGPEQGSLDFETVIEEIKALATEKHNYRTVVIDSFTKLYTTAIATEYDRLTEAKKKIEFSIEKKPATSYSRRLVNWLSRLDMNVILICHEKAEWKNGEQVGETFDGYEKLSYELDLCLNIVKAGPSRNALIKKSRIQGFQENSNFPWSYEAFADVFGRDVMETQAEAVMLATKEQLAEITHLLSVIKLPEGQEEKWRAKVQVESWDEMSSSDIESLIKMIKTNYLTAQKGE